MITCHYCTDRARWRITFKIAMWWIEHLCDHHAARVPKNMIASKAKIEPEPEQRETESESQ